MDTKDKFIQLTSKTYPHGTESQVLPMLCDGLQQDDHGNSFIKIGESECMFTAHLDTACRIQEEVRHVFSEKGDSEFISTDGNTILGADDKAGVCVMLSMIEKGVPGLYYFFVGEERGCIGSGKLAKEGAKHPNIKKVISFDRRGTKSIITHQSGMRGCSDAFADAIISEFAKTGMEYEKDDTGIMTDSLEFFEIYSECINISVGYYDEHTKSERQDLTHLIKLAEACQSIDWEGLPSERIPDEWEDLDWEDLDWEDDDDIFVDPFRDATIVIQDTKFGDSAWINTQTDGNIWIEVCEERRCWEEEKIAEFLKKSGAELKSIEWDGDFLDIEYEQGNISTARRQHLIKAMPFLDWNRWNETL
jgi:hypothetical protein